MTNDSTVSSQGPPPAPPAPPWLVLMHALPPQPDYLRVKVRRRLQKLGAIALKNSVYALPNSEDSLEDFQWLVREIVADGGKAMVCEASFVGGITNEEVGEMFDDDGSGPTIEEALALSALPHGAVWVTREGVKVDRIASAWLIRRFIDHRARFKFVPARGYQREPGERRFDMFGGEYTHEGDRCTFETLVKEFRLRDRALRAIAEIVHDIDCKDDKFERPETGGIKALIGGIVAENARDEDRLARGAELFEELYRSLAPR